MSPALRHVRVLDLSRLLPGPFATLVLADLGARVDKVEDVRGGDYLRHMPPLVDGTSAFFLSLNRNKRSICLDLKQPEGKAALAALLPFYDVVIDQFRPGVMDRLGLSHAQMLAIHPALIVCALTGYGQDGPLASRAGHDLNYLARSGVLGTQGPAGSAPQPPGFQLADVSGGLYAVIAIQAALAERERTKHGAIVDISMVESSMGFALLQLAPALFGVGTARGDEPLSGGLAAYGVYATRDGKFVALGALEPKFWMAFAQGAGLEADMSGIVPGPHQPALKARVADIFATRTRDEWAAFGRERDCCLEPVLEPHELRADPHLTARGAFFDIATARGPLPQFALPVTDRDAAHSPPPDQGEHTDAILREAGFDDARIAALRATGAVR
jgi:hypothetical protein